MRCIPGILHLHKPKARWSLGDPHVHYLQDQIKIKYKFFIYYLISNVLYLTSP